MTRFARSTSVAALLSMTAGMSHALTADTLWQSLQGLADTVEIALIADTETREGAELRLSNVVVSFAVDAGSPGSQVRGLIDQIVLTEQPDGSVVITQYGEAMINLTDAEGVPQDSSLVINQTEMSVTVSEVAGGLSYDAKADSLILNGTASLPSPMSADPAAPQIATSSVDVAMSDLVVSVKDTTGDARDIAVALTASNLNYTVTSADEAMPSTSVQTSATQDVAMDIDVTLPAALLLATLTTPEAWSAAFAAGMAVSLEATQGESVATMKDENPFLPMDVTYTALPGTTGMSVDQDGFAIDSNAGGLAVKVITSMLPIPSLDINMGPVEVAMSMPLMAAEAAQEFGLLFKMADVTVNDEAWAVIDPAATLPRDPAQLVIDASGTAKIDLFALMAADADGTTDVVPPQPETLNISELTLKLAGAALAGSGAFTFDNAGGAPVPVGEANVSVQGANGLIDKLIALGLVSEQDAGGARMMMAMFMNPASGPDDLTSKIEAKADGSIFVNGQQVQ